MSIRCKHHARDDWEFGETIWQPCGKTVISWHHIDGYGDNTLRTLDDLTLRLFEDEYEQYAYIYFSVANVNRNLRCDGPYYIEYRAPGENDSIV